ncbi:MAG: hypothetical protein HY361_04210 [Candidatus Aenigmarchaeota archaeon]|nr:hypothetical protein [Candidatus Aenigmarchaeota archaeon]
MSIQAQIALCSEHYRRWKDIALTKGDMKAMERAFFWLELQTAFIALHALEQSRNDIKTKRKLIIAKTNLSKKLAEYANEVLNELR